MHIGFESNPLGKFRWDLPNQLAVQIADLPHAGKAETDGMTSYIVIFVRALLSTVGSERRMRVFLRIMGELQKLPDEPA